MKTKITKLTAKPLDSTNKKKLKFSKMYGAYKGMIEETEDCWNLSK
jgi:hypothetical protein